LKNRQLSEAGDFHQSFGRFNKACDVAIHFSGLFMFCFNSTRNRKNRIQLRLPALDKAAQILV
jgi:hypothetical protein